jgi:hypothetical protein
LTFSARPDERADETQKTKVTGSQLFKSGEDAPVLLDFIDETFDIST